MLISSLHRKNYLQHNGAINGIIPKGRIPAPEEVDAQGLELMMEDIKERAKKVRFIWCLENGGGFEKVELHAGLEFNYKWKKRKSITLYVRNHELIDYADLISPEYAARENSRIMWLAGEAARRLRTSCEFNIWQEDNEQYGKGLLSEARSV